MNPIPLLSCHRALLAVVLALAGLSAQAAPRAPLEVKGVPAPAIYVRLCQKAGVTTLADVPLDRIYTTITLVKEALADAEVVDAEGVIVLPAHLADELAEEAVEMTVFEDFVQEKVLEGRSILGLYPPTDEQSRIDFAAWRRVQGR
jgi:hypothetical protein